MKNKWGIVFLVFFLIAILATAVGCASDKPFRDLKQGLESPHKLHRLFEFADKVKSNESGWSAGGFLLFFGAGGQSKSLEYTKIDVMMAFERPDLADTYAIIKLPLGKINIRFQEEPTPTVAFFLKRAAGYDGTSTFNMYQENIQGFFDEYLAYAVISIREEDWPESIELPLNKENYTGQ